MQDETDAASRPVDGTPMPAAPSGRISFERLRERSDELELLISGLLVFAMIAVMMAGEKAMLRAFAFMVYPLAAILAAQGRGDEMMAELAAIQVTQCRAAQQFDAVTVLDRAAFAEG
mgnify:CR=1 FL=1